MSTRTNENLKLENQLCFPIYVLSRLITKRYQPYLSEMGITYPQYLVLLALWENDNQTINAISQQLYLNTNTVTPLLKRMERQELVTRNKSKEDERKVIVSLTQKGKDLHKKAETLPTALVSNLCNDFINPDELIEMRDNLQSVIKSLI